MLKTRKNPKISVNIVTKVPEAIAGSTPTLVRIIGILVPKIEPKIKLIKKKRNHQTKI